MRTIKFAKGSSGRPSASWTLADGRTRGVQLREPASNAFLTPITDLAAAVAAGGTLADDTYFYLVTATDGVGESTESNEDSATTSGTNNSVSLTWSAVADATGYRVYRSLTSGSGFEFLATSATNSFTDDGSASPTAGVPPAVNTSGKRATLHFDIRGSIAATDLLQADARGTGTRDPETWHL